MILRDSVTATTLRFKQWFVSSRKKGVVKFLVVACRDWLIQVVGFSNWKNCWKKKCDNCICCMHLCLNWVQLAVQKEACAVFICRAAPAAQAFLLLTLSHSCADGPGSRQQCDVQLLRKAACFLGLSQCERVLYGLLWPQSLNGPAYSCAFQWHSLRFETSAKNICTVNWGWAL